jgi:hypothetical protein
MSNTSMSRKTQSMARHRRVLRAVIQEHAEILVPLTSVAMLDSCNPLYGLRIHSSKAVLSVHLFPPWTPEGPGMPS